MENLIIKIIVIIYLIVITILYLNLASKLKYKKSTISLLNNRLNRGQKLLHISYNYDIRTAIFTYKNGDIINPKKEIIIARNGSYYGYFYVIEDKKQIEVFLKKQY